MCFLDGKRIHNASATGTASLCASATRTGNDIILKVVNVTGSPRETQIDLRGVKSVAPEATATVLTSAAGTDENSLEQPTKVSPVQHPLNLAGSRFRHTFPANSLTVLRLKTK